MQNVEQIKITQNPTVFKKEKKSFVEMHLSEPWLIYKTPVKNDTSQ